MTDFWKYNNLELRESIFDLRTSIREIENELKKRELLKRPKTTTEIKEPSYSGIIIVAIFFLSLILMNY